MKGVILNIAPNTQIIDLSHEILPQDILAGALLLWRSIPFFPDGTIHLAVIDPGVGTPRRAIAAQIGTHYFVGPDNGLISLLIDEAERTQQALWIGELNRPTYWLPVVSNTFHGRDIFAPAAAHLAAGTSITELSTRIIDPVILAIPRPEKTTYGWVGQVIHIDRFGNLSTNINASILANLNQVIIEIHGNYIDGLVTSFGEQPAGTLVALIDSSGLLAISVVNGNAEHQLSAHIGDIVQLQVRG